MKTPTPQLLPSGKYFVRLRLNGQTFSRTFDTEKEAETWALSVKAQYKAHQLKESRPDEKKTLRTLIDEYIESTVLAPATVKVYKTTQKHFVQIMDKPYNQITNWQRVVNLELKDHAVNSVSLWWSQIRAVLNFHGLTVPTIKLPKKSSKRKNYLDSEQIKVFCNAIYGTRYEAFFLMMLHSLRVSEALAVQNDDIEKDGIQVHGTKTEAAERFVPFMIPRLKEIIFDRPPATYQTLSKNLRIICEENDLPELTPHGLRITFASLCYQKRVPERVCMKIAGWQSLQVMHDVYIRISEDDVKKYAEAVSELFH